MAIQVLHIIKSLGRGGAERLLPETIAVHNASAFKFHVIYFLPWKNQMVADLEQAGATVTCLRANNNAELLLQVRKLANYIRKHNIQIVHAHLPWAGIVARMAGKIAGVPVIYTEHNKWERYNKGTFYLNKLTFPWQKTVVAVSKDVADSIKKYYKAILPHVQVISNGVNTETFVKTGSQAVRTQLGIPATAKVVGIVSVFRVQKRLHIWLEIAKKLHEKDENLHFIVVGAGPLEQELLQLQQQLQQKKYVHFVGLQTEVKPYYEAMDVFMMTSEFEGLPIALLEAMSMQVFPICTTAGGIGEVLTSSEVGFTVPTTEPYDLAPLVSQFFSLRTERQQQLKQAARNHVIQQNSMNTMVQQLEDLYKETVRP